ncbi:hypothetical protein Salat_1555800 [Sesamum alatum]|uniref:CCHC-type domain-containing protein n=1 Tax=Sesamum alatum TaxID=300844 RepID=A0AAE1YD04_9LAMI|nr:hypothetical protein Salat_1555800 [Sesamum alatum]
MLLPFSTDVEQQRNQREKMVVMSFLAGLPSEFETAKSQILSTSKLSSLEDAFRRVLHRENTLPTQPNSVLISRTTTSDSGKQHCKNSGKSMGSGSINSDKNTGNRGQEQAEIVCHYCHNRGHIKRECRKLQYKKTQSAHIASSYENSEKSVTISADEYARLTQLQETVKPPSGHVTALVKTGSVSQREDDDLLVYDVIPNLGPRPSTPAKPPIIYTYSRRPQPPTSDLVPEAPESCPDKPMKGKEGDRPIKSDTEIKEIRGEGSGDGVVLEDIRAKSLIPELVSNDSILEKGKSSRQVDTRQLKGRTSAAL